MAKKQTELGFKILPTWAKVLVVILAIIDLVGGYIILGVVWILIGHWVGKRNQEFALNMKRGTTASYLIGFGFGLPGLLGYWIYYKIRTKKKK